MKTLLAILLFALSTLVCRAETVDYSLTVQNAPGGIGDFSWTVASDGFIQPPPPPILDAQGNCTNCDANLFTPVMSSPPSNGNGCQITGVWLYPDFGPAPFTEFSPLCDGLYSGFSGGVLPDVGTLGSWQWNWTNPDNSINHIALTISDPVSTPEPRTLELLGCGLGIAWIVRKVKL